jgi:hypothetical protein
MNQYQLQYVGGGWDLWVIYDINRGSYASAHSRHNWVASFPDTVEAYHAATKKCKELNDQRTETTAAYDQTITN